MRMRFLSFVLAVFAAAFDAQALYNAGDNANFSVQGEKYPHINSIKMLFVAPKNVADTFGADANLYPSAGSVSVATASAAAAAASAGDETADDNRPRIIDLKKGSLLDMRFADVKDLGDYTSFFVGRYGGEFSIDNLYVDIQNMQKCTARFFETSLLDLGDEGACADWVNRMGVVVKNGADKTLLLFQPLGKDLEKTKQNFWCTDTQATYSFPTLENGQKYTEDCKPLLKSYQNHEEKSAEKPKGARGFRLKAMHTKQAEGQLRKLEDFRMANFPGPLGKEVLSYLRHKENEGLWPLVHTAATNAVAEAVSVVPVE